ncbi:hypothetical protein Arub01_57100 [Actinomadura rubrobrunea]|uniref:DUF397 domain-containing protein n=1 Tax=Actinomadura rubrobrunea TaxID=115335 RepID=A0A9W6Q3D0_9ACTN|nr:DUF397 domain-containing protein [Actinomadura rubrobrunea]GLW67467.1 hypothetical protein Arub01_57100 [Actinomadura rubrobrunea]
MSAPAGDLAWRKSSHSTAQGGDCVEVASFPKAIAVRDSKAPERGYLTLSNEVFADLVARVKRDEMDM